MANTVISTYGQELALKHALRISTGAPSLNLMLFTNNLTGGGLDPTFPYASFNRPTYGTYADQAPGGWSAAVDDGTRATVAAAPQAFYNPDGVGAPSYGYAIFDTGPPNWIAAGLFAAPVLGSAGDYYALRPRLQWRSKYQTAGDGGGFFNRITVDGRKRFLQALVGGTTIGTLTLRLFQSPASGISAATVLGDLTQCNFPGYAAATSLSWDPPAVNGSGQWESRCGNQFFTRSTTGSPQTVYGSYYTDSTDGALIAVELWSLPVVVEFAFDFAFILGRQTSESEFATS